MAVLRRGKVTTPHKKFASVLLTRTDGSPVRIPIEHILFWDDIQMSRHIGKLVMVHYDLSSIAVRETFEAIDEMINGKAVQP